MKRVALLLLAAIFFGCSAPTSSDPSVYIGFVWRDAAGLLVEVYGEPGQPLLYRDSSGYFWQIDPETLACSPAAVAGPAMFAAPDCTGAAYVVDPPSPMMTFTVMPGAFDPSPGSILVRSTEGALVAGSFCSSATTVCNPLHPQACVTAPAVPFSTVVPPVPLQVPKPDLSPPLHPDIQ